MKLRETETEKPQKDYASVEVVAWDPNISTSSKQRETETHGKSVASIESETHLISTTTTTGYPFIKLNKTKQNADSQKHYLITNKFERRKCNAIRVCVCEAA